MKYREQSMLQAPQINQLIVQLSGAVESTNECPDMT